MPAGNFDQQLQINPATNFVEWPTGPLSRFDGETILRVEVWVLQKYTGAIQMTFSTTFTAPFTSWRADRIWYPKAGGGGWQLPGLFQPGRPALGIAVLTAQRLGVQHNFWWSEEVELY